jgi:hypothetical protein
MSDQGGAAAESAQPAEGQGATDNPNAQYLTDVPEELHPLFDDVLKRKDGDFTKRFQKAAEFQKQWEPYSQIEGLNGMSPDEVADLVGFYQTMNDPQAFIGWYEQAGKRLQDEFGYQPSLDEDAWVKAGQENGWFDPDDDGQGGGEPQGLDPASIEQMVKQALEQELAPVKQFMGSQQQEQAVGQIRTELEDRYKTLLGEHQLDDSDDVRDDILTLANAFAADESEQDPIGRAFEKYLRMTGKAKGDMVDEKLGHQNGNTLGTGSADTSPESYSHDDPRIREAVLNRIRG